MTEHPEHRRGKFHFDGFFDSTGEQQNGRIEEEKKQSPEDIWKGVQASELDIVEEGEQLDTTLPISRTNNSAQLRKGRVIRMGSATL